MKESLQRIEALLQRQVEAARSGNYDAVNSLTQLIDTAVHAAGALESLDHPECRQTLLSMQKLRGELDLTLQAQRAEVAEKLNQTRRGGQTLKAYRDLSTK
jgi:hypothetical protein